MPNQVAYKDLADETNDFMTGQAIAPYLANLPDYASMIGQRSQNTSQMLEGQLPTDVINQIAQQSAERGVATGTSGSPNANSAYLRALGLNSLGMMQQGSQNLTQSIADTPVPELWNPMALQVPQILGAQEQSAARTGAALQRAYNPQDQPGYHPWNQPDPGWGMQWGGGLTYTY